MSASMADGRAAVLDETDAWAGDACWRDRQAAVLAGAVGAAAAAGTAGTAGTAKRAMLARRPARLFPRWGQGNKVP
jgi:hypothetical protein